MRRADARGYPSLWRAEQAKREPGLRGRTVRLRSRTVPSLGGPSGSPGIWETLWRRPSWVRIPPPALFTEPCAYSQTIGEIISFGLWMRREGYRESAIQPCTRALKAIARRADLLNPEAAKSYLASAPVTENRKDKLADDLARFYRYKRIPFVLGQFGVILQTWDIQRKASLYVAAALYMKTCCR